MDWSGDKQMKIFESERQALVDVYEANGLQIAAPAMPHFEWEGVVCNNAKAVEKVFFESMALKTLPLSLFTLHDLRELWLEGNKLSNIPEDIGNLKQLQILWLKANQLNEVPGTIGELGQLRELSISENCLQKV